VQKGRRTYFLDLAIVDKFVELDAAVAEYFLEDELGSVAGRLCS
jgi:hypothetical protein